MIYINYQSKELSLRESTTNALITLPQQKLAFLLKVANENLERDLVLFVEKIKEEQYGHFAWICTWRDLRLDDLEGGILFYYLVEIIKELRLLYPTESIKLHGVFPAYFRRFLSKAFSPNNLVISYTKWACFKDQFRIGISPLTIFASIFSAKFASKTKPIANNSIWLSSGSNVAKNRYRSLLGLMKNERKLFFTARHSTNVNAEGFGESLNFANQFQVADLFKILVPAIKLRNTVGKASSETIVACFIKSQQLTNILGMMLRELWIERAMTNYKPKVLFFTTANTYSPARLMTRLAAIHNIPSVVVACRSMFTDLRTEERACTADLIPYHLARIGDYFVVWDVFSKHTLVSQGIASEKIFISQASLPSGREIKLVIENALLILFTHEIEMNQKMLETIKTLGGNNKLKVFIRTHPLQNLTIPQKQELMSVFSNFVDCSAIQMMHIEFRSTIAIAINSTAAVEACSYGAGVIWLPYLNYRSVIFYPVMKILGAFFNNDDEFSNFTIRIQNRTERNLFIDECKNSYSSYFVGKDDIYQLFSKLQIT